MTDTLKVCKHCDSILDKRWWKALVDIFQAMGRIYDRNGTFQEKQQRCKLIVDEIGRLESLPREKQ